MSGREDWFESAKVVGDGSAVAEHPHDTEDLVRLVRTMRREREWTEAQLASAAGVPEAAVRRFEAMQIVPAEPLAMRLLEVLQ
nr:helix-turn-helix transcriptional regulator [Kibdelosporangium sp. MJ126-NF4]CEL14708.1 hypothetical protein [Kibdelosporangium sp. MJ126-NF4]CTQ96662.1 hypothetical protein [Kibdelosporangium sp. MJ126-NF4]